ncbi:MAG: YdcF family protein [Leptothrix sp. (in: Bacteria)]|nr:YdcF family protein [Leptothrix sp. (in: b-proteobacteria)]
MNDLFMTLGIEAWKPVLGTLLLPPLPLLLLVLVGARLMFRRRLRAWLLILLGVVSLYLACTNAVSSLLERALTRPPPALAEAGIGALKRAPRTAIVVLGGGRRLLAPEYGISSLHERSIERLRYGIWLGRETSLPLIYSGGISHGEKEGPTEAEIAARIAEREFGRPLRWTETDSRDTRENALRTVALLRKEGMEQIVLVTHGYHMRRALRNFERAAAGGTPMKFVVAPMGLPSSTRIEAKDWLPVAGNLKTTTIALHEWLGLLGGA